MSDYIFSKGDCVIKFVHWDDVCVFAKHPDSIKNYLTFSKNAKYLGIYLHNNLIGCSGWIEYSKSIRLKSSFILPEHRRKGYFSILNKYLFTFLNRSKTIYANVPGHILDYHLKQGAEIIKTYKHPSYKIMYRSICDE